MNFKKRSLKLAIIKLMQAFSVQNVIRYTQQNTLIYFIFIFHYCWIFIKQKSGKGFNKESGFDFYFVIIFEVHWCVCFLLWIFL